MPSKRISNIGKPSLLGRKRALVQWLTTLAIIGIPFCEIDGQILFRLDFKNLALIILGRTFPITDLSLFLLICIALTLLFLLVTLALGRAWCGWACPQTTLVDAIEWIARRFGISVKAGNMTASFWQKLVLQFVYLFFSILVGANLVWYFVSPYDFFPAVVNGSLHWIATMTLLIIASVTYLDLAFLRRLFCKEFCPYGRFQMVLVDPGTLTLHYDTNETDRCIQCNACVRCCPTGIDIRRGFQVECINCGRCLDACREVMDKRGQQGIIRYSFGLEKRGIKALFNMRVGLLVLALVLALGSLALVVTNRSDVSLNVARNVNLLPRLTVDDKVANFFSAYLTNRKEQKISVYFALADTDEDLQLNGATSGYELKPREKKRFDFSITAPLEDLAKTRSTDILVMSAAGEPLAKATIYLMKPLTHEETN
ncbi:MAG: 4Fe-4S binding protein [Deltaproteobacteria bacterium]|nr:4Fe-4S binding protein [Deltaproteobacteria bacterium]